MVLNFKCYLTGVQHVVLFLKYIHASYACKDAPLSPSQIGRIVTTCVDMLFEALLDSVSNFLLSIFYSKVCLHH